MGSSHRFAIDDFDFELVILRVYVTLCLIGTHFSPELCNSLFNWHPYSHHSLGGLHWLLMGFDHCNFASPNFAHSCPGDLWHCLNYLPPNDWRWMLISGNPNSSLMTQNNNGSTFCHHPSTSQVILTKVCMGPIFSSKMTELYSNKCPIITKKIVTK